MAIFLLSRIFSGATYHLNIRHRYTVMGKIRLDSCIELSYILPLNFLKPPMRLRIAGLLIVILFLASCKDDDTPPVQNPGNTEIPDTLPPLDLNVETFPYDSLSKYGFFIGEEISDLTPHEDLLLYEPITPLFTDYAEKTRYVWMPEGESASYVSDFETFDFPDGTILIKNFYYENTLPDNERRVMETRLLFKRDGGWEFADYVWNEEQTEAHFDLDGRYIPLDIVKNDGEMLSLNYRVPSQAECTSCHKISENPWPNGPKPQNLNADFAYQDGVMNQLMKWTERGFLTPDYPGEIETVGDWEDETLGLKERVRAYLDANCAHCHQENSHCSYRDIRLAYHETDRDDNLGICVPPAEIIPDQPVLDYIITAGSSDQSMIVYRMNSLEDNIRMPLIGKSVIHEEGVELLTEYINSLEETCP